MDQTRLSQALDSLRAWATTRFGTGDVASFARRCRFAIVHRLCCLLSLLPLRLLYGCSHALFLVVYCVVGYRKKIVAGNLRKAFPDRCSHERRQMEKAFYRHLCDLSIEHIKALSLSPAALNQRMTLVLPPLLETLYRKNQSILLVAGHLGNWEWTAHAFALQTPYVLCAAYQPLRQSAIDQMVYRLRTRFRRKAIPIREMARYLLRYQGVPQAVAFLVDQAPWNDQKACWTTFLNQPTAVALTAAKLAQKCNLPIFYMETHPMQRGHYLVRPTLVTATPRAWSLQEIARAYTQRLEADILRNPAAWLWSHRRWK